jgi:hypothetical protein
MPFTKAICRLRFDLESHSATAEEITGKDPQVWNRNDVQFQMGAFRNGAPVDISSVTKLTLELKPSPTITGSALFTGQQTSGFGTTLTAEQWEAGTHQHFTVELPATDNDINLGSALTRQLHLYARAECAGATTTAWTLGKAILTIEEDGSTTTA